MTTKYTIKSVNSMFEQLSESHILLRQNGVFRESAVYQLSGDVEDFIYAKVGSGYIRLMRYQNMTTKKGISWVHVGLCLDGDNDDYEGYEFNSLGVMVHKDA